MNDLSRYKEIYDELIKINNINDLIELFREYGYIQGDSNINEFVALKYKDIVLLLKSDLEKYLIRDILYIFSFLLYEIEYEKKDKLNIRKIIKYITILYSNDYEIKKFMRVYGNEIQFSDYAFLLSECLRRMTFNVNIYNLIKDNINNFIINR